MTPGRASLPTASGWIDPDPAVPALVVCYDGQAYGWVKGEPTGAYALPYRGARPPKTSAAKLRDLAKTRGWRPGAQVLRGRWKVSVNAEPESEGGGLHLEIARKLGQVMLNIYADAPGAAGPYRWGWSVERMRHKEARGSTRSVIRQERGELAEGATWPDVVRVALRAALEVDSGVCAADNVTRRGEALREALELAAAPVPEVRPGAPIAAAPAPVGQRKTRRPGVRKGSQSALFS